MEGRFRNLVEEVRARAALGAEVVAAAMFPHYCVGCGKEGDLCCADCLADECSRLSGVFRCPACGDGSPVGRRCGKKSCLSHSLDAVITMAAYGNAAVRELLQQYKYSRVEDAGAVLKMMFGGFLEKHGTMFGAAFAGATVIAVPLHFFREASRGFNQTEIFAAMVAERYTLPLAAPLRKKWQWSSQASQADDARRVTNAEGTVAFVGGNRVPKRVVLVDDVYTTGATMGECAKILRNVGTEEVIGVTVLRR